MAKSNDTAVLSETLEALRAEIEVIEGAIDMMALAKSEASQSGDAGARLLAARVDFLGGVLTHSAGLARQCCEDAQASVGGQH